MVETFFRNFLWLDDTDVQKKPLLFNCNVAKDFDELSWLISLINGRNTVTNIFFFINCSVFFEYNGFMPYLFTYRAGWRFGSGSKSSGLGVKKLLICFDCATLVSSATISYNKKRQQPNLFNLNQKIIIKNTTNKN